MSQVTTHILDTSRGKPATGISVIFSAKEGASWKVIGSGVTNEDGRIPELLPEGVLLEKGIYKIKFETGAYFAATGTECFYPFVEITVDIHDSAHYHIPLLVNPFGYSTYRGS
jgi:5-hydroxyisourate hydrolase